MFSDANNLKQWEVTEHFLARTLGGRTEKRASTPSTDADAIERAALDYIERWYEGDARRIEDALHPEFAMRIVPSDPKTQKSRLDQMRALSLVHGTRAGGGKATGPDRPQRDAVILDQFENLACVKIVAEDWVDYLHMAKYNGRWLIVNVPWELKPRPGRQ